MPAWLIWVLAALALWMTLVAVLTVVGRRGAARELASLLPNLVRLFRGLMRDPRVPRGSKVLLGLGALWLLSPIDLIPEFVPVAGPLDDAIVAAFVLRHVVKGAGRAVVSEHWAGSPETLERILRAAGAS